MQQVEDMVADKMKSIIDKIPKCMAGMDKRSERMEAQLKDLMESNARINSAVENIAAKLDSLKKIVADAGRSPRFLFPLRSEHNASAGPREPRLRRRHWPGAIRLLAHGAHESIHEVDYRGFLESPRM